MLFVAAGILGVAAAEDPDAAALPLFDGEAQLYAPGEQGPQTLLVEIGTPGRGGCVVCVKHIFGAQTLCSQPKGEAIVFGVCEGGQRALTAQGGAEQDDGFGVVGE